jgi:hypothetical protein
MACLKCGSEWVTRKGKDMVSCPECCKLQRWKARKQGRLPAKLERSCKRCGEPFSAEGSAMSTAAYCKRCRPLVRRERARQINKEIAAGERIPQQQSKPLVSRHCLECGKQLRTGQRKYCRKACFYKARNEGRQSWDRTRQEESYWHRGGRWANAPSTKYIGVLNQAMRSVLKQAESFRRMLLSKSPHCLHCGNRHDRPSSNFCSNECASLHTSERSCKHCGRTFVALGARGPALRICKACKKRAKQECSRRRKRKYGRNHRQRARHHGVRYVPVPVKEIYERDNYTCQICSKKCLPKAMVSKATGKIHPRSPSIDHIVPMCRGGEHVEANLQTACFKCNSLKSSSGGGQLRLTFA